MENPKGLIGHSIIVLGPDNELIVHGKLVDAPESGLYLVASPDGVAGTVYRVITIQHLINALLFRDAADMSAWMKANARTRQVEPEPEAPPAGEVVETGKPL